jgi:hypothetical protein
MGKLLLVFRYAPAILKAVAAAEEVVGAGKGQTKKQLVLAAIHAVAVVGVGVDNKTVAALSALVDEFVCILNSAGVFGKAADIVQTAG